MPEKEYAQSSKTLFVCKSYTSHAYIFSEQYIRFRIQLFSSFLVKIFHMLVFKGLNAPKVNLVLISFVSLFSKYQL